MGVSRTGWNLPRKEGSSALPSCCVSVAAAPHSWAEAQSVAGQRATTTANTVLSFYSPVVYSSLYLEVCAS